MKKVLFFLLICCAITAHGQHYYNEWIDYSKTYYKFKLAKTGLYRISDSVLTKAGLDGAPAESFQLWRNGVQVPIYTSVASGTLSPADYIEFWGEMNDGKPDKELYKKPEYQLNDKWSLETDSATYFLTVNTNGASFRLAETPNNTSGNTLAPEPYFMYTAGTYYHNQLNDGFAVNVGEYLYSSSYDNGEGWTGVNLDSANKTTTILNLYLYPNGPDAVFNFTAFGKAILARRIGLRINSAVIDTTLHMDYFDAARKQYTIPISLLRSGADTIEFQNKPEATGDRMVVAKHELTYPRVFNFGGASNFEFTLPEKSDPSYLEISNFSYGAVAPLLYDLTNGMRYVGDISAAPVVRFLIDPSPTERKLVLVKSDVSNTSGITSFEQRKFIDYTDPASAAKYMIITNKQLLQAADGTNPVEEYRAYRSSAAGGGYDAKIYLENEINDQFGYGIIKNPIALRNFILYARNHFSPGYIFIIGKGINYKIEYGSQNNPDYYKLNLVPTFGWPASDALLTADPGSSIPQVPIGRLSVINTKEVAIYLKKIKEFEQAQAALSPNRQDREWMKNVVHLNGISDPPELKTVVDGYLDNYKRIISDTLFGGRVTTFAKVTTNTVEQISSSYLETLFKQGITLITYFGHSGSNTLGYNLDNPNAYDNKGKYPLFIGLGCNAGDFFNFNTKRFVADETLSEKYVLAEDRGTIGFIASTHFGIVHYLDIWNTQAYKALSTTNYGAPIGDIMIKAAKGVFEVENLENFYAIANVEETELHGDPALRLNPHAKPDYVIDESLVKIAPDFISVAEPFFKVSCKFVNIGKAVNQPIVIEVKREYPDKSTAVIYRDSLARLLYADSLSFNVPIDALRDKGSNKITITVDADNAVDELYETNNSVTKEVVVYEDELKPIYPNNYAIVNKPSLTFIASTANAFSDAKEFRFELDTTEFFNSPLKVTKSVTTSGGLVEFAPGISFMDSTVYYWRVGQAPPTGSIKWNTASFIYLPGYDIGFNQSHLYQQFKIMPERLHLDSTAATWRFDPVSKDLFVQNGVYPTTSEFGDFYHVSLDNGSTTLGPGCNYNEIIFNVIDPVSFKPWKNDYSGPTGLYKSIRAVCGAGREYNFEFFLSNATERKKAMDFIDQIPAGAFVTLRSNSNPNVSGNTYVNAWKADTTLYGAGNSLYHKLFNQGFANLDSFYKPRSFSFVFKKDNQRDFAPEGAMSEGIYDRVTISKVAATTGTSGTLLSPAFGPAKTWKQLIWSGRSVDTSAGDDVTLDILGVKTGGTADTLFRNINPTSQHVDLTSINTTIYPYLQLKMHNSDTVFFTPYQLRYWRLTYEPVPEGALAPNIYLKVKDTVEVGEPFELQVAFKNISETAFDSLKVKLVVTDANNVPHVLPVQKLKPLNANDTLHLSCVLDSKTYVGLNKLYLEVNPDNDQPEQYHFNNYAFRNFFVRADSLNPLLDVTFDNIHILNNDIVSSKPYIVIKLKDEATWALLKDTALLKVQVRYPDNSLHPYQFNSDTLQFIPAQTGSGSNNTATVNFAPYFHEDGTYELLVSGKDASGNKAGTAGYRVAFEVMNKAMISNMLNYPNPFTTSTAFVFTLTGSEIPQEFKIQVLTVTGKIVREITRQELGPLHIGRNITEFKWDGTDQYGQKLANGVYLYHVVTSLDGNKLDKYKSQSDNTDKYFNKGYGKMYLMR